ncbi:chitotriosidase-1 [Daldinia bambusicola]|nr:chitotriosidase-1 [Daldinia bambusicola]
MLWQGAKRLWPYLALFALAAGLFLSSLIRIDGKPATGDLGRRYTPLEESFNIETDAALPGNATQLVRRGGGDYSCHVGVPCKTYACCGSFLGTDTGTCGFGPTFCGSDCDSQCDAKSECGQYADPPGKKCPLNVCCSGYGFCGSTEDFCVGPSDSPCQSNCVLEPPVPAGGSGIPVLSNKVIGYYEAWSARRSCRPFPPSAIPVEGLTHVNFAFAYIDPQTLQVTTMDSETPEYLFIETTDIKQLKSRSSELQVFVSIGGWTFSDNDTSTQSVFPDIARDPSKSRKFADNLVSFMTRYGFDGVDLDWEYPGAPDRGGLEDQDIANFVSLSKTLRETFRASARGNYGLTFTIPTSYWYLRWFDVPGLLKYADWVNMMSYDLHGVWDEHNPIGSIVQAHTNLTEIKLAADLLWRNNVPPGQVVFGVGFYGRSFTLKDTDCTTPGCQFSGPADKGPCTNSAGTLAYFEIMDIINDQKPKFVYDKEAAANYIVFGDKHDQWISYDDATTFKQKVEWANEVGLGGVMIWSVDQDDNDFSALSGLIGQSLPTYAENLKRTSVADAGHWTSVNGQKCTVSDCEGASWSPPAGYTIAPNGKFQDRCRKDSLGQMYKYVLCPTTALPQSCTWRGSGSCHGQCHEGEVTLAHSPHGSESCLKPGQQAFCCVSNTWAALVDKCDWGNHCDDCPSDSPYSVNTRKISRGLFSTCDQHFCCPYNFQGCHWVGKGTCDDNECDANDVQVALDPMGDTGSYCAGGLSSRQKPLCCNSPQDLNPFLPVPLEDLFPTLPPTVDVPAFDQQSLSRSGSLVGESEHIQAFFFLVIDGPPGTVSNADKRDGSHLEFITRGVHQGQEPQLAYYVCMNDSAGGNCDDMHLDGLAGTILRMPSNMGFATYAVAHAVRETNYSSPPHLAKRAPAGAKVFELEYSYNFSKVKRDSGDIFFRVDYSNSHKYYEQVVQAPHQRRDGVKPRFWSTISSVWRTITSNIRSEPFPQGAETAISKDNFNVLIYGDDGKSKGCDDQDGFLKLNIAGSMSSKMKWGYTLVGRIQPLNVEEAYGYFDSDLYMSAQVSFDGKGTLNVKDGAYRNLFATPATGFEASHPGIVSFSPQLNIQVSMIGDGEIDGKFDVSFEAGSSKTLTTNAPPGLGSFGGDVSDNKVRNAGGGQLAVKDRTTNKAKRASFDTVFALNFDLEATMGLKLFGYETNLQNAGAEFTVRIPHAIQIVGDIGNGSPGVVDAPQPASADVIQRGTVQDGWDDGVTHPIGLKGSPVVVLTGGESPAARDAPEINGYAVFGDRDFMSCSSGSFTGELVCYYDIYANNTDGATDDEDPGDSKRKRNFNFEFKAEYLEPLTEMERRSLLDDRAAGPSGGPAHDYPILEYDPNAVQVNAFPFRTPTYPNGNNGAALDAETGRNERYALANPQNCIDTTITANGPANLHYESDHVNDRSIFPNFAAIFFQSGEIDLADGAQPTVYRSSNPLFAFGVLDNYFGSPYRTWVPVQIEPNPPAGSASDDVADALGSTNNFLVMINLEKFLNMLKGRMNTLEGGAASDNTWRAWMRNPTQANAEAALSSTREVFAMFNYMNDPPVRVARLQVFSDIRIALAQFDFFYGRVFPNLGERLTPLWDEFQPVWDRRVVNFATRYVTNRLNQMDNVWGPLLYSNNPNTALMAQLVLNQVNALRGKIANEIRFV